METLDVKTIKECCDSVILAYQQCLFKLCDDESKVLFKVEYDRLRVWAGNIGVYARYPASADDRLHDDGELRGMVLQVLSDLTGSLQMYVDSQENDVSAEQPTSSDSSSHDSDDTSLTSGTKIADARLLRHIRRNLSQLFSVLALVRRPTNLSSMTKVFNYDFKSKLRGDFESLIEDFATYVDFYLTRTFRSPSPDGHCTLSETLFSRLRESAIIRRKALLLKARHQRKIRGDVTAKFAQLPTKFEEVTIHQPMATQAPISISSNVPVPVAATASEMESLLLSETVPSIAEEAYEQRKDETVSQAPPKSSKSMLLLRGKLDVPRPPKLEKHDLEANCYVCGLTLDRALLQEDQWKKHLLSDIDPFVCLFDCAKPDVLYKKPEDWYKHMQEHRMEYCCMTPNHRGLKFQTQGELEAHLMTDHASKLSRAQISLLLRRGRRNLPDMFDDCPLCGRTPAEIQSETARPVSVSPEEPEAAVKMLRRHLESHMYELALLSIPPHYNLVAAWQSAAANESSDGGMIEMAEHRLIEEDLGLLPRDIEHPQEHVDMDQISSTGDSENSPFNGFHSNTFEQDLIAYNQHVPPDVIIPGTWPRICKIISEDLTRQRDADWHDSDDKFRAELISHVNRRAACPDNARLTLSVAENLCTNTKLHMSIIETVNPVNIAILPPKTSDQRTVTLFFSTVKEADEALVAMSDFVINGVDLPVHRSDDLVEVSLGQVPYIDLRSFSGRQAELKRMADFLKPGLKSRKLKVLALNGVAAVGKTQLTIAYASHHCDDYELVLWLDASSEATIGQSFEAIARRLFGAQADRPTPWPKRFISAPQTVAQLLDHSRRMHSIDMVHNWLSDRRNTQWLLVFDNFNSDGPDRFDIRLNYPPASHGAIIVTTRLSNMVADNHIHVLPFINMQESLKVLEKYSERRDTKDDPYAARLVERLHGQPLAITVAGTYIKRSSVTFKGYFERHEQRLLVDIREQPLRVEFWAQTLYTAIGLSYLLLRSHHPRVAKLLELLAYFDNQNVWFELLCFQTTANEPPSTLDPMLDSFLGYRPNFTDAMDTLQLYCFVEEQYLAGLWSMHKAVHDWALNVLERHIDGRWYSYAFECVATRIDAIRMPSQSNAIPRALLADHAVHLVQSRFLQNDGLDAILPPRPWKMTKVARLLWEQKRFAAAEQMYVRTLAEQEKTLGPEHTSTLDVIMALGNLYADPGQRSEPETVYKQALAAYVKEFGQDHHSMKLVLHSIEYLRTSHSTLKVTPMAQTGARDDNSNDDDASVPNESV